MRIPLLVPLDDPGALRAAVAAAPDALLLDLGAPGGRAGRRAAAAALLSEPGLPPILVRLAPLGSGLADGDLDAVAGPGLHAAVLPGAEGLADVERLGAKLAVREAERGLPAGAVGIVALPADTPRGALLLPSLASGARRLLALGWDGAALGAALGGAGPGAEPRRAARGALLLAAAAAGVPALDFGAGEPSASRRDGFAGRLARAPGEVEALRSTFTAP